MTEHRHREPSPAPTSTTGPVGRLAWMDVVSEDFDATLGFYSKVMGWSCRPLQLPNDEPYAVLGRGDQIVAGAESIEPSKGPSRWTVFIQVPDLRTALTRATQAGGAVTFPLTPMADLGSLALAADADGSTFGLWEAATFDPTTSSWVEGSLIGGYLSSAAPDATARYYSHVFGWSVTDLAPHRFELDAGGVSVHLQANSRMPGWLPVMGVASLQTTATLARSHGGTVERCDHDPSTALVRDSARARFLIRQASPSMVKPENQAHLSMTVEN